MTLTTNLVTDPAVARRLAESEYAIDKPRLAPYWLCSSMGSDGGMHLRTTASSRAEAQAWMADKVDALAARILSGACDGVTLFLGGGGKPYLG